MDSTTIPIKNPNRRGRQTQEDGRKFEDYFCDTYDHVRIQNLSQDETFFFNIILSDKNIQLNDVLMLNIKSIRGNGKTDLKMQVILNDQENTVITIPLQVKSIRNGAQLLVTQVNLITDLFVNKYPNGAVFFQKIVGYGEYALQAKNENKGGYGNKKDKITGKLERTDNRFLISETSQVEREEIKLLSMDKEYLMKVLRFALEGEVLKKPEYFIFCKIDRSTDPKDWGVIKYEDLFAALESTLDSHVSHLNCKISTAAVTNEKAKALKIGLFSFKMRSAGSDDFSDKKAVAKCKEDHRMQVNASPMSLYNLVEKHKLTISAKNQQSLTVATKI